MKKLFPIFPSQKNDLSNHYEMLKSFGNRIWSLFFHCSLFFFLFILTIFVILWVLNYTEENRVKFYPPDNVIEYLTLEHNNLEAIAEKITPLKERKDIQMELFGTKCIEIVNPKKVYGDEYGIYFITNKSWYIGGEYGIFIAKDEKKMPPDLNWGLIEGRIFAYALLY